MRRPGSLNEEPRRITVVDPTRFFIGFTEDQRIALGSVKSNVMRFFGEGRTNITGRRHS